MKLTLTQSSQYTEPEVDIRWAEMTPRLQKVIDLLQKDDPLLTVRSDTVTRRIHPDTIYILKVWTKRPSSMWKRKYSLVKASCMK